MSQTIKGIGENKYLDEVIVRFDELLRVGFSSRSKIAENASFGVHITT